MKDKKTYFISGGGTGGHIYPAFTVVEKLLKDSETEKIFFIGNPENLEFDIAKRYDDVTFLPVKVSGMPRKIGFSFVKWAFKLIIAVTKTIEYIKKYNPDGIFTTGGYVSAPVLIAAVILKKPYMIHDCDSVPGLVSKMAAPMAKIVSVAFENSKKILKSNNIIFNGNPVREAFFNISKDEARKKLNISSDKCVIFAMGGSQGAKTINTAVSDILETLAKDENNYIILQTGKNKFDEVTDNLNQIFPDYKNKSNIMVKPYFDDMVYPLKACDIVIARAGSLSLSEIVQCNVPSILIPYPFAAQNHQRKNAQEMVQRGLSLYIEDSDCTGKTLLDSINELIFDENKINSVKEISKSFAQKNAADEIVNQLKSIIK